MSAGVMRFDVDRLSGHNGAKASMLRFKEAEQAQSGKVLMDLSHTHGAYANGLAASAAMINHSRLKGLKIEASASSGFMKRTHLMSPRRAELDAFRKSNDYWNTVWLFSNNSEVYALTVAVIENLEQTIEFEAGVIFALKWALFEVLDNVLEHSHTRLGFFSM